MLFVTQIGLESKIYKQGPDNRKNAPEYIPVYRQNGSVVERPLCDREVAGSIHGRVIPMTIKIELAALSLGALH